MTKGDNKNYQSYVFIKNTYTVSVTLWYVNSIHNIIENVPQTYQRNIDISISTLALGKAPVLLVFNIFES